MRDKSLLAQSAGLADQVVPDLESALKPIIKEARKTLAEGKKLAKASAKRSAKGSPTGAAEPKKRRRLRSLIVFGVLGGVAALVYKALSGGSDWQSAA